MKNIIKIIKNNSLISGIMGSMIAWILILCIRPASKFIWKLLFSWSNSLSRLITDRIIRAAIIDLNLIDFAIFLCVVFLMGVVIGYSNIFQNIKVNTKKKEESKITRITKVKYIFLKFALISSLSIVFCFYLVDSTGESINVTQKMRMCMIAPYINEQIEEELWSKWYLISSKIDYIDYNNELDIIAENNNIELPKPYY